MTPWYIKIVQEICPHNGAEIIVTHSCVTCETTQVVCADCKRVFCSITDCT